MTQKVLNTRVSQKHDTEAKWITNSTFTPLAGEIIVYDKDDNHSYDRVKIGDGATNIANLPFLNDYHLVISNTPPTVDNRNIITIVI